MLENMCGEIKTSKSQKQFSIYTFTDSFFCWLNKDWRGMRILSKILFWNHCMYIFCFLIFRSRLHCNKKHRTTFQNRRPNWSYFCPCLWGYAKSFPSTNSIGKIWHDIFGNNRQNFTILFRWPRFWNFQTMFTLLQKNKNKK